MKKSSLTTAVVAGLAGAVGLVNVSNAVNVNPDGLGEVLIYPYYTVAGGNDTLFSVVNTTDDVKAVKVRFLESLNSREVLDFNLYLSPFDVWTGAIVEFAATTTGAIPGSITTSDRSCTVPRIPAGGEPFRNLQFTSYPSVDGAGRPTTQNNDDAGPDGLERTRHGYIEVIEMGVLTNTTLANAATHGATGVPANCNALTNAFRVINGVPGFWVANGVNAGLIAPEGGLFGSGIIVDVEVGSALSYNATAIEAFYDGTSNLHAFPGSTNPNLAQGDGGEFAAAQGYSQIANIFDDGRVLTLGFGPGIDAISALFMHNEIYNEYIQGFGFETEWVITFPTKRFHVDPAIVGALPRRPFTRRFGAFATSAGPSFGACEPINLKFWDREEQTIVPGGPNTDIDFSPSLPGPPGVSGPSLCFEAQVVTFNQPLGELSETLILAAPASQAANIPVIYNAGWARIRFADPDSPVATQYNGVDSPSGTEQHYLVSAPELSGDRNQLFGLPAIGFQASEAATTIDAVGVLASYSALFNHRGDRFAYGVIGCEEPGITNPDNCFSYTPSGFAAS